MLTICSNLACNLVSTCDETPCISCKCDHGQAERNDDVVMKIQEIKQIFSAVPQKNVSITHKITINASEVMHINLTITKR